MSPEVSNRLDSLVSSKSYSRIRTFATSCGAVVMRESVRGGDSRAAGLTRCGDGGCSVFADEVVHARDNDLADHLHGWLAQYFAMVGVDFVNLYTAFAARSPAQ